MLAAMVQEHERGLGGWHAEWETLPEICMLAAGALARGIEVIEGLQVDARKMRRNLDATHGLIMAEAVSMALARHIGRQAAHELVEAACIKAMTGKKHLREVLAAEPRVTRHLSRAQIDRALDPARYLGQADEFVARTAGKPSRKALEGQALMATTSIDIQRERFNCRVDGPADAPVLVLSNSLGTDLSMWEPQVGVSGAAVPRPALRHARARRHRRRPRGRTRSSSSGATSSCFSTR